MNKKELLKIIDQAAKDGQTALDLSDNDLTSLPAEIVQLKNLTQLYLAGNNLTSLPAEISSMPPKSHHAQSFFHCDPTV